MTQNNPFAWLGEALGQNEGSGNPIEDNEAMNKAAAAAYREQARLFYDVFGVGRGPELLDHLRSRTIEVDLMIVSATIGSETREIPVNPAEWAYHRNGQNSVVRYIETMVREAMRTETEESPNV